MLFETVQHVPALAALCELCYDLGASGAGQNAQRWYACGHDSRRSFRGRPNDDGRQLVCEVRTRQAAQVRAFHYGTYSRKDAHTHGEANGYFLAERHLKDQDGLPG